MDWEGFLTGFSGFPQGGPWAESLKAGEHRCVDAVLHTCSVSKAIPPHTAGQAVFHLPFQAITTFFFLLLALEEIGITSVRAARLWI